MALEFLDSALVVEDDFWMGSVQGGEKFVDVVDF
jgi:hypothetical protein